MGYYTTYTLEQPVDSKIIQHFRRENSHAEYAFDENGDYSQSTKWYEHKTHLEQFSKLYSDTLFVLSGMGEESEDMWKLYVKNGKSKKVKAIITFPEVNESELT